MKISMTQDEIKAAVSVWLRDRLSIDEDHVVIPKYWGIWFHDAEFEVKHKDLIEKERLESEELEKEYLKERQLTELEDADRATA